MPLSSLEVFTREHPSPYWCFLPIIDAAIALELPSVSSFLLVSFLSLTVTELRLSLVGVAAVV
jgi:hypothetical protein